MLHFQDGAELNSDRRGKKQVVLPRRRLGLYSLVASYEVVDNCQCVLVISTEWATENIF